MWNRFIQVQSADADDARRRTLLNVMLVGVFVSAVIGTLITIGGLLAEAWTIQEAYFLFAVLAAFILGSIFIYLINRKWGKVAIYLFVLLLVIAYVFSDTPLQISDGRSVFFYSVPIVIASLLVHPLAGFGVAAVGCVIVTLAARSIGNAPNTIVMIGFFMLALISWLASRSLEQALANLREININLDRLVQERTQELADALLRERTEAGRSKAILESIADGVIVFDLKGKAISANPSLAYLTGIPVDELLRMTIDDFQQIRALDARNRGILVGLLSNPTYQQNSYRIQWSKRTLSVIVAPVHDSMGARIGTVAAFRDFTREAEIERMKNTFLAIVSHELRTPLNAILGYAEMLKESIYGSISEPQARAADRIMSNSRRLLDIVSDLLDQAQIEAGKLVIRPKPFRPVDLIENVHGVMDRIAAEKKLAFTSELDPQVPEWLKGDIARLQQILVNLINNAIKFTDTGSIHLTVFRPDKKHWAMEVRDTGIGIPEEALPTIFEAFRQVDSSATRKYGGFGLGLTIVKQLVELMGGEITVSSKLGVGSTFTVTLPLSRVRRRIS